MIRPVLFSCLLVAPAWASTWYVAPGGDDRFSGSNALPLATLTEALNRAAKRSDGDSVIVLKPGQHVIAKTIEINASHASSIKGSLTLSGQPGAVVTGFRNIPASGWKKPDAATLKQLSPEARGQVVQVPYSQIATGDPGHLSRRGFNVAEVRETPPALLFVNGNPMPLAAWPDQGTVKPDAILDAGPTRDGKDSRYFYKRGGTFRLNTDRLTAWTKERNLWVDGTFGYDWEWSFNQISRVNRLTRTLTLADGEVSGLMNESFLHPGFRVVNAISEISMPGEYCIDATKKRLLLLPPSAGDAWKTSACVTWSTGPLLSVKSAAGFRLDGVVLDGARDGLMEIIAGNDVIVRNTTFRRNGGDGLVAEGAGIHVSNCLFESCGGAALRLSGGDPVLLAPSGSTVDHCLFQRNAWWSHVFNASVELHGVGHQVTDCQFLDLPHMAIEAKGNDFLIQDNLFRRTCKDFRDMGAVYLNTGESPLLRGTVVRGNFFDDIGRAGGNRSAVYLDNATMGVTVEENLFRNVGATGDDWTVMVHGGGYNRVEGNLFLDCSMPCEVAFLFATWAADLLPDYEKGWITALAGPSVPAALLAYPELVNFGTEDHVHPVGIVIAGNLALASSTPPAYGLLRVEGGSSSDTHAVDNTVQATTLVQVDGLLSTDDLPGWAQDILDAWRE
ncbi:right-handed parallel beta-helix repeat-containing protein [Luteolibacter ambystomatis]|uniref:Right-handed parallel beta-helix repeat-containing protein n=1 Tax=Luteolibacter ambystomatis TaxID=2824561 RepID=A0A975IXW3_9BACT|nr:right-handed parallel beta-helix repeat-containing protein [Luteolibacter ambystomatis]QUE49607.1 right-handed parallel beta-helix repeat-containing protein [Luteolibacter ambystomatis]